MKNILSSTICLFMIGNSLFAQPLLSKISEQRFTEYNRNTNYQYLDEAVTLKGKQYFVVMNGLKDAPMKSMIIPTVRYSLIETDGTLQGTKVVAESDFGFFGLKATKSSLLYYEYTELWANLKQYTPEKGEQKLATRYRLNAHIAPSYSRRFRVTNFVTYPNQDDAIMNHFENDKYAFYHINGADFLELKSFPFQNVDMLKFLPINLDSWSFVQDGVLYAAGSQKRKPEQTPPAEKVKNTEWVRTMSGYENTQAIYFIHNDYLLPYSMTLFGNIFRLKGKPCMLYDKFNPENGRYSFGVLQKPYEKDAKPLVFDFGIDLSRYEFRYMHLHNDKVYVSFKGFTGYIFEDAQSGAISIKQLNEWHGNYEYWGKSLDNNQFLFTDQYIFFKNGDTVFYQDKYHSKSKITIPPYFMMTDAKTSYVDQPQAIKAVTTQKYLYYVKNDNSVIRFNPNDGKQTVVALPEDTKLVEWRQLQSAGDVLIIGGLTKEIRKKQNITVFALKD